MQRITDRTDPVGLTEFGKNAMYIASGIVYLLGLVVVLWAAYRISTEVGAIASGLVCMFSGLYIQRDINRRG